MQDVAHHLQVHAQTYTGPERDAFARSAFNRYYYATFLILRSAFTEMNEDWRTMPHKSYPETLTGTIKRRLKEEKRKAVRANDKEILLILDAALRAVPQIADTMIKANGARKVADYEPEVPVKFYDTGRFSLNEIDVTQAHEWQKKVSILINSVLRAWRQIDA